MKAASAPVVMFVDSDDFLEPQALEKAYGAVREITFKNAHYRTDIGKK